MKKILFICAIAMVAACEKSDLEVPDSEETIIAPYDPSMISLEVGVDSLQTKAYKVETPAKMETVGIYAAHHTGGATWSCDGSGDVDFDKMQNERLTYTTSAWLYDGDAVKWGWESLSDRYTFFGYSPFGTGTTEDGGNGIDSSMDALGRLTIGYEVPEECTKQFDLTVAAKTNMYYPATGSVTLNFEHALSLISFQLVNKQTFPDPNKRIKRIKITSVHSVGTLTYDGDTMSWEYSDPAAFTALGNLHVEPTKTAQEVTTDGNYLMMIPQTFEEATEVIVTLSHELGGCEEDKSFYIPAGTVWEAGESYSYIVEDDSYIISERNGASNCYMIHPEEHQTYYIPVDGRINEFWDEYADEYPFLISDAIGLRTEIIWHDCETTDIDNVKFEFIDFRTTDDDAIDNLRRGSGEDITVAHHPNYVTDKCQAVMKVTVPSGMSECNISVAVWRDMDGDDVRDTEYAYDDDGYLTSIDELLWSWHLWVTDYNPDSWSGAVSPTTYEYTVTGGEIHKYSDTASGMVDGALTIWGDKISSGSAIYENKCMMDRHIGAWSDGYDGMGGTDFGKGFVVYQYGRKDPFPGDDNGSYYRNDFSYSRNNTDADAASEMSFAESVHEPDVFFAKGTNWVDKSTDAAYSLNLLWNDMKVANPNPPTLDNMGYAIDKTGHITVTDGGYDVLNLTKSIFDPSPLGWRLPIAGVFSDFIVGSDSENDHYLLNDYSYVNTGIDDDYYYTNVLYRYYTLNDAVYPMSGFIERSAGNHWAKSYGFCRTASPSIQNTDYDQYEETSSSGNTYINGTLFSLAITDFGYILCSSHWTVTNDYSYLRAHGMPARAIQE